MIRNLPPGFGSVWPFSHPARRTVSDALSAPPDTPAAEAEADLPGLPDLTGLEVGDTPRRPIGRRVLRGAFAVVRTAARGLAAVAYPPACASCGTLLPSPDALPLCAACALDLDDADADALLAHILGPDAADADAPPALDAAWARWRYDADGPLAPLLHTLKYGHRPRIGRQLGAVLAPARALDPAALLVPLPLTRQRELERGYNQAEEIARGLASETGLTVASALLARGRFMRSQTHLDRADRRANVAHAFAAADEVAGRSVVLVDDIVTTGATALAAARALRDAGAASVTLWAVAWTE